MWLKALRGSSVITPSVSLRSARLKRANEFCLFKFVLFRSLQNLFFNTCYIGILVRNVSFEGLEFCDIVLQYTHFSRK
jgi:hypothetical protein